MAFAFDPDKSARNAAGRGLPFELVERLEWETALVVEDIRKDYGETRLQVLALMDGRLYAVVVTPRGENLRVISFRKANRKEAIRYGEKEG
jgi:uncharacterized protein